MFKLTSIELSNSEVRQIKDAIHDMDLGVLVNQVVEGEGESMGMFDIIADFYGDMMELFELISFELNLVEEDIVEI